MAIVKKKYETFDIDYQKEINGNTYDIVGQVVVRLADDKINSLNIAIYEDRRNSNVVASIGYSEVGGGDYMEGGTSSISCNLNVNATEEMMAYFNNDIITEIKAELFE